MRVVSIGNRVIANSDVNPSNEQSGDGVRVRQQLIVPAPEPLDQAA